MKSCPDSCSKVIEQKSGSRQGIKPRSQIADDFEEDRKSQKSVISNRRGSSQRQKAVQIGGVTSFDSKDSQSVTNRSGELDEFDNSSGHYQSYRKSPTSIKSHSPASPRSRKMESGWNPTGHNPCDSNCPMAKARERAKRKAELRQQRLDDYLLNKGFSYFDDLCTCSSICLIKQLRKDKFVTDILKSACLFGIGMKLCEELDSWNILG